MLKWKTRLLSTRKCSQFQCISITGTPKKDKKIIFYDSGHWPLPRNQMIKETLSFIDKYKINLVCFE